MSSVIAITLFLLNGHVEASSVQSIRLNTNSLQADKVLCQHECLAILFDDKIPTGDFLVLYSLGIVSLVSDIIVKVGTELIKL